MALGTGRRALPKVGEAMVEWAVWYAVEMGWRVFPVQRSANPDYDKKPFTTHGFKDASTDEAVIRAWWQKYPTANIGLAVPDGWVVVDVDAYHDGLLTLHDLETSYQPLPRTLTNLTGSGGGSAHYCFTMPPGHDPRGTLGPGLDTRVGGKHYIIVPPSKHISGGEYAWESDYGPDDLDPQPAPAWLLALLAQPSNGHSNGQAIVDDGGPIFKGTREKMLLHIGGTLLREGKNPAEVYAAMSDANLTRCIPKYETSHINKLVQNLYKYDAIHKAEAAELIVKTKAVPVRQNTAPHGQSNSHMTDAESESADWKKALFTKPTKAGNEYYPSEFNITHILRHDPKWRHEPDRQHNMMWHDVIRDRYMIDDTPVTDGLLINLAHWFGGEYRMQFHSTSLLEKCVIAHCETNKRDLIQIWLNSLPPWDGTPRLDTWLMAVAKAEDDAIGYARHVSRRLVVSMIARAMVPGCQYREVVILEGPQNIGKSHMLQALASREWYVEMSMNLETKESHMMLQSAWLAELSELDSMNRTEKARLKAFITMDMDTYVPKYRNGTVSYPRRSIMVGTTNDIEYLTDFTGNSRFLPLWVPGPITLEPLVAMRDQLFAEALQVYRDAGESWWHIPDQVAEEATFQQAQRRVLSEWQGPLENWLAIDRFTQTYYDGTEEDPETGHQKQRRVTFDENRTSWEEIARWFLGIKEREGWRDSRLTNPILNCLRIMGWKRGERSRNGEGHRVTYWYRPEHTPDDTETWNF